MTHASPYLRRRPLSPHPDAVEPVGLATSRYADFHPSMGVPVRITVGRPRFALRYEIAANVPELAPYGGIFDIRDDRDEFTRRYRARLDQIGVDAIFAKLERIAAEHDGRRLVLLCFEDLTKPGEWCHRRIAAEWIEEQPGIAILEVPLTVYHGTYRDSALEILRDGFEDIGYVDADGNDLPGVFVTSSVERANEYGPIAVAIDLDAAFASQAADDLDRWDESLIPAAALNRGHRALVVRLPDETSAELDVEGTMSRFRDREHLGVCEVGPEGSYPWWVEAALERLGVTPAEIRDLEIDGDVRRRALGEDR